MISQNAQDYGHTARSTLAGSAEPLVKTSDLQRIFERISVSEKLVFEMGSRAGSLGDRMFGSCPEECAGPQNDSRVGIVGTIEDALDALGHSIDRASSRLARIENVA